MAIAEMLDSRDSPLLPTTLRKRTVITDCYLLMEVDFKTEVDTDRPMQISLVERWAAPPRVLTLNIREGQISVVSPIQVDSSSIVNVR